MRITERIDPFLKEVDIDKLLSKWFPEMEEDKKRNIKTEIFKNIHSIRTFWYDNPDLRFSQVLISSNLIPNYPGTWFYYEEDEILIDQGHEPRDVLFWGRNYNKEMERLPRTEWILIKDMSTDHIQAVLDGKFTRHPSYLKAFNDELERRK